MRRLLACLLLALCPVLLALTPHETPLTAEQDARYRALIHELRCLVCQNQTIADSDADLASDLRTQVHERIAAGESDEQIRHYVTERYGDFVLYKPPFKSTTAVLWVGPFALVALGVLVFFFVVRRRKPQAPQAQTPEPRRAEIRALLDSDKD